MISEIAELMKSGFARIARPGQAAILADNRCLHVGDGGRI